MKLNMSLHDSLYIIVSSQYPLKEVVAVVKDEEAKEDLVSLEKYILEVIHIFISQFTDQPYIQLTS